MTRLIYQPTPRLTRELAEPILARNDPQEVPMALVGIAFYEPDWCWVQEQLIEFTKSSHISIRMMAILCFGHLARIHGVLDVEKVFPVLGRLLKDPDPMIVGQVKDALAEIELYLPKKRNRKKKVRVNLKWRRIFHLLNTYRLPEWRRGMRVAKKRSFYPTLEWTLENQATSEYERQLIDEILAQTRWQEAVPALIRQLESESPWVRAAALETLVKIGNPAISAGPRSLQLLTDVSQPVIVRDRAAAALGTIGFQESWEALVASIQDPAWTVRYNAICSLGILREKRAIPALQEALKGEQDPSIKEQIALSIEDIEAKGT